MSFFKSNKFFLWAADRVHYGASLLVVLLAVQTQWTSHLMLETVEASFVRQQALRDLLWVNLLTQRATTLALSSAIEHDDQGLSSANLILDSVPNIVTNRKAVEDLATVKKILAEPLTAERRHNLLKVVNDLGVKWNAEENEEWFNLLDENQKILADLNTRRYYTYASYLVFIFYILSLSWAIRRRKRAEAFLVASEKQARTLADASFEGLAICRDNRIVEANRAFCTLFEVSPNEVSGDLLTNFISGASMKEGEELMGLRKQSGPVPVEIAVKETQSEEGILHIVAVRDLSERKISETLRIEKEAAEKANQSKSAFLANISHELRTPMHGVLSFARFGIRDANQGKGVELAGYFTEILDSGTRLMLLLNDLLDLSKLEAGKMEYSMENCDLREVIERVIGEFSTLTVEQRKVIKLDVESGVEFSAVLDQNRIAQVVRNIVSNAIKFSYADTQIICKLGLGLNGTFEFHVSNKGDGIPEGELETVFDKFMQSTRTRTGAGGTGLGLAICREIILHHGGQIWARSVSKDWTTFSFELPVNAMEKIYA